MFQNVLCSDGRMHLERQFGNQRIDLTTGDVKTVIPVAGGMNTVIDGSAGTPSATTDKVFLLSMTEVYGDLQSDGTQYEYYKSKGVSTPNYYRASWDYQHWTRSVFSESSTYFYCVSAWGVTSTRYAKETYCVFPAFSF